MVSFLHVSKVTRIRSKGFDAISLRKRRNYSVFTDFGH